MVGNFFHSVFINLAFCMKWGMIKLHSYISKFIMMIIIKLLCTLFEIFTTALPLIDNGIQVWNAISINNTNFSMEVIHGSKQIELRPTLSMVLLKYKCNRSNYMVKIKGKPYLNDY